MTSDAVKNLSVDYVSAWPQLTAALLILFVVTCPAPTVAQENLGMLEPGLAAVGEHAPDFILRNLDQQPLRLSDYRGTPVVLNFFASWCGPCLKELPLLQAAHVSRGTDYIVLGVATQDSRGAVELLAIDAGLGFPIVIDGDNSVGRAYQVIGPPYTYFIDAQGKVLDVVAGAMEAADLEHRLTRLLVKDDAV